MKHLNVRQKYSAARRIFNSLLAVSSDDETLRLMLDVLLQLRLEENIYVDRSREEALFRVYRLCIESMSIAWRHLRVTGFLRLGAPVKETFENKSVALKVKINFRCLFPSTVRHND